jgi:hypothetical protein
MYHEYGAEGSKGPSMLVSCYGHKDFIDLGSSAPVLGAARGLYTSQGNRIFGVFGNIFFEFDIDGNIVYSQTINTAYGSVSFADNQFVVMLVDGSNGYIYNLSTNTLTVISGASFPSSPSSVAYKDTYFIVNNLEAQNSQKYYISDNNLSDPTTAWGDFGTAESNNDSIIALATTTDRVWLFGVNSIEQHYNSGNSNFPFERIANGVFDVGCVSAASIAKINNQLYWVGSNKDGYGVIFRSNGSSYERISDFAIEQTIQRFTTITDAIAFSYQQDGHYFYVVSFDNANETLVFDATTGKWHYRNGFSNGDFIKYEAIFHTFVQNKNLIAMPSENKVFEMDRDTYTYANGYIVRLFNTRIISNENKRMLFKSIELDMEVGVGLASDEVYGHDPHIMMKYSDDGGYTWSSEHSRSFGKTGEFKTRVRWNLTGISRNRIFEFRVVAPVKLIVIDCFAELEALDV